MLRTRSPLIPGPKPGSPFDLHVLSTPPAFVLSQDQTLRREHDPGPKPGFRLLHWKSRLRAVATVPRRSLDPARCPDGLVQTRAGRERKESRLYPTGKALASDTLFSSQGATTTRTAPKPSRKRGRTTQDSSGAPTVNRAGARPEAASSGGPRPRRLLSAAGRTAGGSPREPSPPAPRA